MKEEIAGYVAKDLWASATTAASTESPIVGLSFREEESTNALDFLSLVSMDISARFTALDQPSRKYLFILAHGDTHGSTNAGGGSVLILGSEDLVVEAGKLTREKLGSKIKGGGKGRWQGKVAEKWAAGDKEKLENVLVEASS